LKKSGHKYL
jgi:solute carrier family 9 (sodium/hydrogen exchanger), member 8